MCVFPLVSSCLSSEPPFPRRLPVTTCYFKLRYFLLGLEACTPTSGLWLTSVCVWCDVCRCVIYCNACHNVTALWDCIAVYIAGCINEHWLVASVSLVTIPQAHDCQVSLVALFGVSTALMRANSPKQMLRHNTNCCHTWLIWVGHLSAVEHCNRLVLKCTMLCKVLLKMEQVTSALASLETQAVPVKCVHGQLIFSTDVPCLLPATYYSVSTCKWLCISA